MRILITGAFGFLGSHLLDRLVGKHDLFLYDDFSNPNIEYYLQRKDDPNIIILPSLYSVSNQDYDLVFHLGALGSAPRSVKHFTESWESNVKATFKILNNGNFKRFIFASSSSVYGDQGGNVVNPHLTNLKPKSPYATWKLHCEQMIQMFTDKFQIFRLFNIYGPRQKIDYDFGAIVPKLIDNKQKILLYNNGENMRCFTYVDDCIDLLMKCLDNDTPGIFNLCSEPCKVRKLVEIVKPSNFEYVNINRSIDIEKSIGDTSETKRTFNWEPQISIEEGLEKTIEYYKR